ncbi:MAG: FitA-like ribbon-helix-helix domain-containing protein [Terracidiphilus sp.]
MATIVIRNLDESVRRRLKVRAALNGRSMEAEVRQVLEQSIDQAPHSAQEVDIGTAIHRRFAALGGVDLQIPPRTFSNKPLPKFDE